MRHLLITTALLFGLSILLMSAAPTYAQVVSVEASSTPDIVTPNPFPLATTTPTASNEETAPSSTEIITPPAAIEETPPPAPTPVIPAVKKSSKPAPVEKNKVETPATSTATSTASTTAFMPPTLTTLISGSVYTYARHAPLSTETTQGFLAVAALTTVLSVLMVHKRYLDRMAAGVSTLFSPSRSLPQPQAER